MDFFPNILDLFLLFPNAGHKFKNFDLIDFYILAGLYFHQDFFSLSYISYKKPQNIL